MSLTQAETRVLQVFPVQHHLNPLPLSMKPLLAKALETGSHLLAATSLMDMSFMVTTKPKTL